MISGTRQGLEVFEKADKDWQSNIKKGAYIVKDSDGEPDIVFIATGSEVELGIKATGNNPRIRII